MKTFVFLLAMLFPVNAHAVNAQKCKQGQRMVRLYCAAPTPAPTVAPTSTPGPTNPADCSDGSFGFTNRYGQWAGTLDPGRLYHLCMKVPTETSKNFFELHTINGSKGSCNQYEFWLVSPAKKDSHAALSSQPGTITNYEGGTWSLLLQLSNDANLCKDKNPGVTVTAWYY